MSDTVAEDIVRGVCRTLLDWGLVPLTELTLANGRRADVAGLGETGRCVIVEVKSSRADFASDSKWGDYLGYADAFYFAVAPGFPIEILPGDEGLIVADRYHGEVLRPAIERPLDAARRKAIMIRFARTGAARLQGLLDPPL